MILGVLVKQVLKSKHGHNQPVNKSHKAGVGNFKPFIYSVVELYKIFYEQTLMKTQKQEKLIWFLFHI